VLERLATTPSGVFNLSLAGLYGILLFIRVIGKSAQFPLHLAAGRHGRSTPVSAMIHAATMVSAGVTWPSAFSRWSQPDGMATPPPPAMAVLAYWRLFCHLSRPSPWRKGISEARPGLFDHFPTGFHDRCAGVGAYVAAVFHLVTHAFFKALLFLRFRSGHPRNGTWRASTNEKIDPAGHTTWAG
jgi:NADH-quinone oxidoreductase subunit L